MHDNEFNIDTTLVASLLKQQFPTIADFPIKQVKHSGTDNAIFRLGNDKCIRFPRIDSANEQIKKEQTWLPKLAEHVTMTIPTPIKNGKSSDNYPYHWYIYHWIKGKDAYTEKPADLNQTATILASFINSLHTAPTNNAPYTRRGLPLLSQDEAVRKALLQLEDSIDVKSVTTMWEKCLNISEWNRPPVWLHGDLLPSNLVINNGKLHAIIDFGLMGIGDPACDLIPAWNLFDIKTREAFKKALLVDEDTWQRGIGWALSIALIILPYYKNTNPVLVSVAHHMINEILAD